MEIALRFLGSGAASAPDLGNSSAVLELGGEPTLLIDCGFTTLAAYLERYGSPPSALFITHTHLDHIGGLEGLFFRLLASPPPQPRLYVPVTLVPLLHRRIADQPNMLAEGGANFWDHFQLIPVSDRFWHHGLRLEVVPVRHHQLASAYGLGLRGLFLYSGDTRPIPEVINAQACNGETLFHDCTLHGNPSHAGIDDLEREYTTEQLARLVLYHAGSRDEQQALRERGYRVASDGDRFLLRGALSR